MLRQRISLLLGAFALAAVLPLAVQAQTGLQQFVGTYTLDARASDDVNEAINQAVRGMNFVTRQVARPRLRRTNAAYERVVIERRDANVHVTFDQRRPVASPANGTAVAWEREDGETFQVSTRVTNGRLEQVFRAEDGVRTNSYSLSPDGRTLTMRVTIESDRLRDPLVYNLVYDRAN